MLWASPDLASFLLDVKSTTLTPPIRSDHALIATTFDIHTLVSPTPHTILRSHRVRGKKILIDKAEDGNIGLDDIFSDDPSAFIASPTLLANLPLDKVWDNFHSIVMSAAFAHLPCYKTGGDPPPPQGEARLKAKTSDLGYIIKSTRETFIKTYSTDTMLKRQVHQKIQKWQDVNGQELNIDPVPAIEEPADVWQQWMESVKEQWRAARILHQQYSNERRQQIINEHIDRRDIRFGTHTRETIRSILEISSGRVVLDHLVVEDGPDGLYVIDDPGEIKQRVR
ncbi:hypothetical protein BGX27_009904, partial [Mortierella sp. AM989]